jgi:hypothetical protein
MPEPVLVDDYRLPNIAYRWLDDSDPWTPGDNNLIPGGRCSALFIGGAGDLVIKDMDNHVGTFAVTGPMIWPFAACYVMSATTATGVRPLYGR